MELRIGCVLVGFLSLVLSLAAQTSGSGPASALVPPLVNFSGVLTDVDGKPLTVTVGVTFSLYKDQQGGAPLWLETQNVKPNFAGHYTVTLGSTTSQGIPANIFASGDARWLGAQVQGQGEQPRVLLVSAPYALKAGDAETLGGKPASAFLAASGNAASGNHAIVDPVTGGGKKDYIPLWLSKTKLGKSNLFQSAAGDLGIGTTAPASTLDVEGTGSVRDTLTLFPQGTDPTLSVQGTGFGVSSSGVVSFVSGQTFPGTGTITGVTAGTDLTGGGTSGNVTLNLDTTKVPQLNTANTFTGNQTVNGNLSATGALSGNSYQIGSNLFAFGSYANANAFLGFAGNASTTGIENTASGYGALFFITTGDENTASGWEALFANTTGAANTATGYGALEANVTGFNNTATGWGALATNTANYNTATGFEALFKNTTGLDNTANGIQALYSNTSGTDNTALGGSALYYNTTGFGNTADGFQALYFNTTGGNNTASGSSALGNNTTGYENTGVGDDALSGNTTGHDLTCIGFDCNPGVDGLHNATAIGAHAIVGASDALVLGGTGQYAVKVGIGTTTPSSILTIGRGLGHPVSDSWEIYSSRRWKTNIQTLPNALAKVEQLRGVSYDQKDSGKHEVGVIAEEVGKVVPEVVTYEDNGKDVRGVDYSRLTALLIEAVKQQQREIRDLKSELRATRQTLERR